MHIDADSVAGTYRPAKQMRTWAYGGAGVLWLLFAVINLRRDHVAAISLLYGIGGAAYLLLAWTTTRAHTLVDEDGIRVSQGIGGRRIDWDAITSVSKSEDRWDPQPTLTVTTDAGKDVLTHIPKPLRKDFIAYANAYRSFELPALE